MVRVEGRVKMYAFVVGTLVWSFAVALAFVYVAHLKLLEMGYTSTSVLWNAVTLFGVMMVFLPALLFYFILREGR